MGVIAPLEKHIKTPDSGKKRPETQKKDGDGPNTGS